MGRSGVARELEKELVLGLNKLSSPPARVNSPPARVNSSLGASESSPPSPRRPEGGEEQLAAAKCRRDNAHARDPAGGGGLCEGRAAQVLTGRAPRGYYALVKPLRH
eukprot:1192972-Prorocentrum_minimum.AAC.1